MIPHFNLKTMRAKLASQNKRPTMRQPIPLVPVKPLVTFDQGWTQYPPELQIYVIPIEISIVWSPKATMGDPPQWDVPEDILDWAALELENLLGDDLTFDLRHLVGAQMQEINYGGSTRVVPAWNYIEHKTATTIEAQSILDTILYSDSPLASSDSGLYRRPGGAAYDLYVQAPESVHELEPFE